MKAIVIYPKRMTFVVNVPEERATSHEKALNWVWEECQGGIEEITKRDSVIDQANKVCDARLRSSMVGDLIMLEESYYMVDSHGFMPITAHQFMVLQNVDDRDRLMGWNWLVKYKHVEANEFNQTP